MTAAVKKAQKTIDYIENLPEGVRAELIDGEVYDTSAPTRSHQRILGELYAAIFNYIKKNNGACEVNPAPFAVYLDDDSYTYLEPDISVICDKSKLDEKGCHGAPDWIIEIVSPSTRYLDYYEKTYKYKNAGVWEYWIVDKDKDRIVVINYELKDPIEYSFADTIKSGIWDDFTIDFSGIKITQ